jgi:hypothetical protein
MDKIIEIKEKCFKNRKDSLWVIVSDHAFALNCLTRKKSLDKVDLVCLNDLGFKIRKIK